jgi:hypothetical protein
MEMKEWGWRHRLEGMNRKGTPRVKARLNIQTSVAGGKKFKRMGLQNEVERYQGRTANARSRQSMTESAGCPKEGRSWNLYTKMSKLAVQKKAETSKSKRKLPENWIKAHET